MAPVSAPAVWLTTLALSLPDLLAHDSSPSLTVPPFDRLRDPERKSRGERSRRERGFKMSSPAWPPGQASQTALQFPENPRPNQVIGVQLEMVASRWLH